MSLTGNLTGEAKQRYVRSMIAWVGLSFMGMFLGLVAVSPLYFHLPSWSWLQKTLGIIAFVLLVVGGGFYRQYRSGWTKRGE